MRDIFSYLKREQQGKHEINRSGTGGDLCDETKGYEFGDPFFLHLEGTLMKALNRDGPGVPLRLEAEDF